MSSNTSAAISGTAKSLASLAKSSLTAGFAAQQKPPKMAHSASSPSLHHHKDTNVAAPNQTVSVSGVHANSQMTSPSSLSINLAIKLDLGNMGTISVGNADIQPTHVGNEKLQQEIAELKQALSCVQELKERITQQELTISTLGASFAGLKKLHIKDATVESQLGKAATDQDAIRALFARIENSISPNSRTTSASLPEQIASEFKKHVNTFKPNVANELFSKLDARLEAIQHKLDFTASTVAKAKTAKKPQFEDEVIGLKSTTEVLKMDVMTAQLDKHARKIQSFWKRLQTRKRLKKIVTDFCKGPDAKRARKKLDVYREILSTEKAYVQALTTCNKIWVKPLTKIANSKNAWIKREEIDDLFLNWEQLLTIHQVFMINLEVEFRDFPFVDLAEAFINIGPSFMAYSHYVPYKDSYSHTALQKLRLVSQFKQFYDETKLKTEGGETLESFLARPVQRLPRYILLLNEAWKSCEENSKEKKKLKIALDILKEITTAMNDQLTKHHTKAALEKINILLATSPAKQKEVTALVSGQDFLLDGLCFYAQGGLNDTIDPANLTQVHLFLFDDVVLLFMNPKGKKLNTEKKKSNVSSVLNMIASAVVYQFQSSITLNSNVSPIYQDEAKRIVLRDAQNQTSHTIEFNDAMATARWKTAFQTAFVSYGIGEKTLDVQLGRFLTMFAHEE